MTDLTDEQKLNALAQLTAHLEAAEIQVAMDAYVAEIRQKVANRPPQAVIAELKKEIAVLQARAPPAP